MRTGPRPVGAHTSASFWLRAYPRRWRAQRADEITEVLHDLAPVGATRVDPRTATDLVLSGWRTRWRQRPPVGAFLRYRLLGRRPAPAYDGWLRDDLEGALYPWRAALLLDVVIGPFLLALAVVLDWSLVLCAGGLAVGHVLTVVDRARDRQASLETLFGSPPEIGPMSPYRLLDE